MYKKFCFLSFLFLLFISCVNAAVTSTATVKIENSPIKVDLVTTDVSGEQLIVKTKIYDANGYSDIKKVEVKVIFNDTVYMEFKEAKVSSQNGAEATYVTSFFMINAEEGIYVIEVKANDGLTESIGKTEFEYPPEFGLMTGAFIQSPGSGDGILTKFFDWLRNIFSSNS